MSHTDRLLGRSALRLMFAGLATALLAGCSSDATRLADPFGNPFADSSRFASNDAPPRAHTSYEGGGGSLAAAPIGRVSSAPLAGSVQSAPLAPVRNAGLAAPAHESPVRSAQSYAADELPTASTPLGGGTASAPHGLWTASGGTPITMAQGETIPMLAQRYGVPADALLRVNGYSSSAQVQPGTRLTVPVYQAGAHAAPVRAAEAVAPARTIAPVRSTSQGSAREKLSFVKGPEAANARSARTAEAVEAPAKSVRGRTIGTAHEKQVAKQESKPETKTSRVEPPRQTAQSVRTAAAPAPMKVAKAEMPAPVATAPAKAAPSAVQPAARQARTDTTTTASVPQAAAATATADAGDQAAPEFRWPARGRIISGFKAGNNDGINIAVPEGTQVKAAEAGVVAYAGSELKGYGNLVLIRHPNGFVSAYANNGELDVKRGDTVKRGQTIAKSGQTGNVNSPQLHFELRKGQTPVDPTQFLAGL